LSELLGELSVVGAESLVDVLANPALLANATEQSGEVVYAAKLTKEDLHLTPLMTDDLVLRTVRLGRAFTFVRDRRVIVDSAARSMELDVVVGHVTRRGESILLGTARGVVELLRVRPEGRRSMDAAAWWSGARLDEHDTMWG
jgi:methionyl-tRNA formyltransferase